MNPTPLSLESQQAICRAIGYRASPGALNGPLAQAVERRLQTLGLPDPAAYLKRLSDPGFAAEERPLLSSILTSRETYFLRDQAQMRLLREQLIPELLLKRAKTRRLRVWSAACSTGEEPYTLAILLAEATADERGWQIDLLGSDIDLAALALARQACYREWSFRGCPETFRRRYFHKIADGWELEEAIRRRVRFRPFDLADKRIESDGWGMPEADLILCRNLFIYLDDERIGSILARLTDALAEDGYLLVGPGELHHVGHPGLIARVFPEAVVYQKSPQLLSDLEGPLPAGALDVPPAPPWQPPPSVGPQPSPPRVAKIEPDPLQQAWQLAHRGDHRGAERLCRDLVERFPLNAEPHYLQAVLALADGLADHALVALREVLYLDGEFIAAYPLLIDLALSQGNRPMAMRVCRQGIQALARWPAGSEVPHLGATRAGDLLDYLRARLETLEKVAPANVPANQSRG